MRRTFGILLLTVFGLGLSASDVFADHTTGGTQAGPPINALSVQSFQTDLFTGSVTSDIPILVPPGAAGVAPKIALHYNSGVVDEMESTEQAQWSGLGWTLDVGGFVLRDTKNTTTTSDDTFKIVFGGVSHDLVLVDSTNNLYRTKDETFWKIQYNSQSNFWTLTTKDGTKHRFGFNADSKATGLTFATNVEVPVTFRYLIDEVTTTSGVSIRYSYFKQSSSYNGKAYDQAVYPDTITYAYRSGALVGPAREMRFIRASRTDWTDESPTWHASYHELSLLDAIEVKVGGSLVRKYDFTYDYSIDRDPNKTWGGGAAGDLTLKSVTMFGTDGVTALPALTLAYTNARLTSVTNGIGGTVSYTYEAIIGTNPLRHRALTRSASDGLGWSATTNFLYGSFALSSDGKEFQGHAWTHAADPLGHYSDTYFHQDDIKKGREYQIEVWSKDSALFSRVTNTYAVTETFPGVNFVSLTRIDTLECEGTLTCEQKAQTIEYDANGNPTRTYHFGHVSETGDEREERTDWLSDTTNWIFRPSRTALYDSAGAVVREKWLYYDGLTWGALGTRGLLTKEEARLGGDRGNGGNPVVSHVYDVFGNKTSTTDPLGCTTSTTYESSQTYPVTVTTCLGHTTSSAYDSRLGVVTSQTDPNGQTTTSTYDALGRLTRVTGPLDTGSAYGTVSHFYLDWGIPSQQRVETFRTEQHGTANYIWTKQYFDGLGRIDQTHSEGPGGQVIIKEITFDVRGKVAAESAPRFSNEQAVWTHFTYDPVGRQIEVLHPDGTYAQTIYSPGFVTLINENWNVKRKHFDAYHRLEKVEEFNDDGTYITTYRYDAAGSLRFVTNHLGHQTEMRYDLLGRKTFMSDPNMGVWTYTYDLGGNLKTQTDAKNQTLTFDYDLGGRLLTKTYPGGGQITWTYDDPLVAFSKGRLTKVVDLTATTTFTYDVLGRVTQTKRTIDGVLYTMSQSYDALNRVTSETFPDNEIVTYNYNEAGWLSSSPGYITSVTYNARGQRTQLQYANGVKTTRAYDPETFRLIQLKTNVGGTAVRVPLTRWIKSWTVQPTAPTGYASVYRGLIRVTDEDNVSIGGDIVSESGLGTVSGYIKTASVPGTVPVYKSFCYRDTAGNCIASALSLTPNGTPVGYASTTPPDNQSMIIPFVQNGGILLDGLEGETPSAYLWSTLPGLATKVDHFYNNTESAPDNYHPEPSPGFLETTSGTGKTPLRRWVNSIGRHYYSTSTSAPAGFTQELILGYLRTSSATGRVALYRYFNAATGAYLLTTSATAPTGYGSKTTLGYIWTTGSSSTALQDLVYRHDNVGNITSIDDVLWTASREFTYDALNRLTSAAGNFGASQAMTTQFYRYDAIGNILEKAGVLYNYCSHPQQPAPAANCASPIHPSAVATTSDGKTYTYDANGNMLTGGNRTFVWDADNRATSITTGGVNATMGYDYTGMRVKKIGSTGTTYFPFSGYEAGPGTLTTKYIRIGIENIASKKSTGEKIFYHNDHLGGVNITTNGSGLLAQIIEYDPWGKVSKSQGAGDSLRRFTGHILDPETGLYYYGARYYDPELGRFISPDPFVGQPDDPQNLNRYSYVVNNPVNAIDPSGYFHIVKKKKKSGFFRIFSSIFFIVIGIITLQPEFAALGAAVGVSEAGISLAQILGNLSSIAWGIAGLAGLGTDGTGPPGAGAFIGDFGFNRTASDLLESFFSPALQLAADAHCEVCTDSRLDLARMLLGLFQEATYHDRYEVKPPKVPRGGRLRAGDYVQNPGRIRYPGGIDIKVPRSWVGRVARDEGGFVYQRPGATGNADMLRLGLPDAQNPQGYIRYYNSYGQPLNIYGKPGSDPATHIRLDYGGPFPGYQSWYEQYK